MRSAVGADGGADGHFPLPRRGAGELQIGHIGAGDQQDETDRAQQDQQCRSHVAYLRLLQRHHRHALGLVHPLGIGSPESLADDLHLRLGGLQGDARLEASGDRQIVALVDAVRIGL